MYCYHCMNQKGSSSVCPFCHKEYDGSVSVHHLRPGTVLNHKYLVGCVIGEGGFGITYIGRDTTLDMRVAIKEFYPSGYSERNSKIDSTVTFNSEKKREFFEKGKRRFLNEARNVAKFSSEKGIVDVRDYFEANGTAYIIMEYLDGIDLNQYLLRYGPIRADKVFELMLPVMRSLEKINAAGIIHRDISPDNIMFLTDGSLKLMDFGSARHFTNNEKEMSVMLKQGYAPEEQYSKNGAQGPWTDVYGMCATIYRCITGEVPEDGLDRIHRDDLKPPSQLGVKISEPLEAVLMYGLAVFKENRCQNMTELIELVVSARAGESVSITPGTETTLKSHAEDGAYKEKIYGSRTYGDSFDSQQDPIEKKARGSGAAQRREPQKKKNSSAPIVILAVVAILLIIGIVLLIVFADDIFGRSGKKSVSQTEIETQAESTEAMTEAVTVYVPDVIGKKLTEAKEEIEAVGLAWDVGTIESSMPPNYVVEQEPAAGTAVTEGAKVILYIPDGIVTEAPTDEPTDAPTDAPTDEPTEAPTEEAADTYYNISGSSVYLHKDPSRTSAFYYLIPSGSAVKFLELEGDFYKVRAGLFTGYVLSKFFSKSLDAETDYDEEYFRPMTCTEDIALCSEPSEGTEGFILEKGEEVTVVGYLSDEGFYEVVYNDTLYYVAKDDLDGHFEDKAE